MLLLEILRRPDQTIGRMIDAMDATVREEHTDKYGVIHTLLADISESTLLRQARFFPTYKQDNDTVYWKDLTSEN